MIIRKAESGDLKSLLDMYDRLYDMLTREYNYPFEFSRSENESVLSIQLKSRFCGIFVAQENNNILGFAHGSISKLDRRITCSGNKTIGRLDDIFVDENARGTGISQKLYQALEDWFSEQDIKFIESYVLDENIQSMSFHKKIGFSTLTRRLYKKL